MAKQRPLYVMVKPPGAVLPALVRQRAALGIDGGYAPERLHSTFLRLGESTPATLGLARHALDALEARPFPIGFDKVEGNLLKGCNGLRPLTAFQRALAKHMLASGCPVLARKFWLHLCLAYTDPIPARRTTISRIGWMVEEVLLVESVHGEGRHIDHGRWRLRSRQHAFDF